jgi:hypothetical protein
MLPYTFHENALLDIKVRQIELATLIGDAPSRNETEKKGETFLLAPPAPFQGHVHRGLTLPF